MLTFWKAIIRVPIDSEFMQVICIIWWPATRTIFIPWTTAVLHVGKELAGPTLKLLALADTLVRCLLFLTFIYHSFLGQVILLNELRVQFQKIVVEKVEVQLESQSLNDNERFNLSLYLGQVLLSHHLSVYRLLSFCIKICQVLKHLLHKV